jgi:hypothetical protein
MKGADEIESFLIQLEAQYETVGEELWVVKGIGPDLVLKIAGPVLVFRMKVMEEKRVPEARRLQLYQTLLELNATEMIHGAYGLEGGSVVATAALQLENMDFNEFQSAIDDIGLAVGNHYPRLSELAA